MEKSMLGEAGFMSGMDEDLLNPMIDIVKKSNQDTVEFWLFRKWNQLCEKQERKKQKPFVHFAVWDAPLKSGQKIEKF